MTRRFRSNMQNRWLYTLGPPALLIFGWQGLALMIDSSLLPAPFEVFSVLLKAITAGELLPNLAITLARLFVSFFIAMTVGTAIGILLGLSKAMNRFFDSWLIIFLNIPALVTIILCYVWFGLTEAAAILAIVINKLPNVVVTLREGTRALNKDYFEMAESYNFGRTKTIKHVILPQLHPFLIAAARSGLALIWKIVLVVELLGRSDGMGYQLHLFFQLFDVASIMAYTIAFVTVIQMIELTILKPLDRQAQRWRR